MKYNENIDWTFDEDETDDIHPEFVGHENFYNFLVDNNILDKYIKNFNHEKSIGDFLLSNYKLS